MLWKNSVLRFSPRKNEDTHQQYARQKRIVKYLSNNSELIQTLRIIGSCHNYDFGISGRFPLLHSISMVDSNSLTIQATLRLSTECLRRLDMQDCSQTVQDFVCLLAVSANSSLSRRTNLSRHQNHVSLIEIIFGIEQGVTDSSVQELLHIAPNMLHLKNLTLTMLTFPTQQPKFEYRTGFPELTSLTLRTTSRRFEDILPLLGRLENLTIVGWRTYLIDDQLLSNMKSLQSLIKLVLVLRADEYEYHFPVSKMIRSLSNHVTLREMEFYCGGKRLNWISDPRFTNKKKLLDYQFECGGSVDGDLILDELDTQKRLAHIQGSRGEDQQVMYMVCTYKR